MVADTVTYGRPLTNVHGSVYFVTQKALWKTDRTAGGTSHVSTIVPVADSCRPFSPCPFPADIYYPVGLGGHLFYAADAGGHGVELWQTDGSPDNGAGLLGDLRPGPDGSRPASLSKGGRLAVFHGQRRHPWTRALEICPVKSSRIRALASGAVLAVALASVFVGQAAAAGSPTMVADVNPGGSSSPGRTYERRW